MSQQQIPDRPAANEIAGVILGAAPGTIRAIVGATSDRLRYLIDESEPRPASSRALFVPLAPSSTAESIVNQVLQLLSQAAFHIWPVWYTDTSFSDLRNDTLGQQAARIRIQGLSNSVDGLNVNWAQVAAMQRLAGKIPRVASAPQEIELAQLALVVSRSGLTLIFDRPDATDEVSSFVSALEWMTRHSAVSIVVLFPNASNDLSANERILYGAHYINASIERDEEGDDAVGQDSKLPWLAPTRGMPHPLSVIEKRLAEAISKDRDLNPLFSFNRSIQTTRNTIYRVDLLWDDGRVVVEIDGYPDHSTRDAFRRDRHRDYELILSGYTVLRIANEEIQQDIEIVIAKIKDIVHLRREIGGRRPS